MGVLRLKDNVARKHYAARLNSLAADARPQWGTLTLPAMLAHLTRSFEMSLGEIEVRDQSNLFNRTVLKWIFLRLLPWPKGKIKAPPIFLIENPADFETERLRVLAAMDRFVVAVTAHPETKYISPYLGPQPLSFWAFVHGKHLDHHLRQFGV